MVPGTSVPSFHFVITRCVSSLPCPPQVVEPGNGDIEKPPKNFIGASEKGDIRLTQKLVAPSFCGVLTMCFPRDFRAHPHLDHVFRSC